MVRNVQTPCERIIQKINQEDTPKTRQLESYEVPADHAVLILVAHIEHLSQGLHVWGLQLSLQLTTRKI